jgi:hypothetical protein
MNVHNPDSKVFCPNIQYTRIAVERMYFNDILRSASVGMDFIWSGCECILSRACGRPEYCTSASVNIFLVPL